MDERTLIHAAQRGDVNAFNQLVLCYQDIAYNQAFWIMKDSNNAEDITQEVFIKAYQRISTFRGGSFRSWLLRIVMNTCFDEIRRRKHVTQMSAVHRDDDGEEHVFIEQLVDPEMPIEEQIERTELRSSLQRHLEDLPDKYREMIQLVDVLELDYHEAAQVLGVPIGTVKSRVARGRLLLRNEIVRNPELMHQLS